MTDERLAEIRETLHNWKILDGDEHPADVIARELLAYVDTLRLLVKVDAIDHPPKIPVAPPNSR